jgi:hypothetical protein
MQCVLDSMYTFHGEVVTVQSTRNYLYGTKVYIILKINAIIQSNICKCIQLVAYE